MLITASLLSCIIANVLAAPIYHSAPKMVTPAHDNPKKEWSYAPKMTTVIGLPFVPTPVQITFDMNIFSSGNGELGFFYGENNSPINGRQHTFVEGWIPIVTDSWVKDGIAYNIEIFSTSVPAGGVKNLVQMVRYTAKNISKSPKTAILTSAFRCNNPDHRFHKGDYNKNFKITMNKADIYRNSGILYTCPAESEKFSVVEQKYSKPFTLKEKKVGPTGEFAITKTRKLLKPGQTLTADYAMPRLVTGAKKYDAQVKALNFDKERAKIVRYWKNLIEQRASFNFPEKRVNDSRKAALVHLILATREKRNGKRQGSGLPYDGLFLNDYVDMRWAYDVSALPEFVKVNIPWLKRQLLNDGMFIDTSLSHGKRILASHGQAVVGLAHHGLIANDLKYSRDTFPMLAKSVEWIVREHKSQKNGLLRPSIPYDNEMIKGYYTSHNLWGILGLRYAIRVAKKLGKTEEAKRWRKAHDEYKKAILKAIDWTVKNKAYVAPGLYKYQIGKAARAGFDIFRTNQDWENNLLVWPSELLEPNDERVFKTLEHIRKNKYREGCMTYRDGQHIHQYITYNQANQYVAIGKQKQALLDMYHILLHNTSTHAGFENLVEPWQDRDPWPCPPPHAWAAAKTALFFRNIMVAEIGGQAGIDEAKRELHIFRLISPTWATEGKKLEFTNAPTEFGKVSATLEFNKQGAELAVNADYHTKPAAIVLRVPYFAKLKNVEAEGAKVKGDLIYLPADTKYAKINWAINKDAFKNNFQDILKRYRSERGVKAQGNNLVQTPAGKPFLLDDEKNYPATPLSFDLVKQAFVKEFARRFAEHKAKKGKIIEYKIRPILTAEQRIAEFNQKSKKR